MKVTKCKFCKSQFGDVDHYVSHLESAHNDLIPEDMTPYQFFYFLKTGKNKGKCIVCGKDTNWNPKTNKYHRICKNPECKNKYRETFKNRMIGKYGKVHLLNDPEQQRIMLANRDISGKYIWSDKTEFTYTGSYELSFLEFLDKILEYESRDIFSPSPHNFYYIYKGEKKLYIPDFYIESLNLQIEIKDGGINDPNANHHPKIIEVDREKERLKDEVMSSNKSTFNYLKIYGKNNKRFFDYLEKAKYNELNNIKGNIVML